MKKACFFMTVIVCMLTAFVSAQDTIVVAAIDSIYARVVTVDGQEQLVGPAIQLLQEVFKDSDVSIRTMVLPWKRAIVYLQDGKIDALLTFIPSEERAKFAEITDPYDETESSVVVKKGHAFPFETWDDLIGLKGFMLRGSSTGPEFDDFKENNLTIIDTSSVQEILKVLMIGQGGVYAVDKRYDIIMEAKKMGIWDQIEILPIPVVKNDVSIGVSKLSPFAKNVPEINAKIAELKADGTIERWIEDALNATVRQ